MYVRWLGAFGYSRGGLHESIKYELDFHGEVAVEETDKNKSYIRHARVGLIVKKSAIIKVFNGDCFSVKVFDGGKTSLKMSRNPKSAVSDHREAWAEGGNFTGFMIKDMKHVKSNILKTIQYWSVKTGLPVYCYETSKIVDLTKIIARRTK